MWLQRTLQLPQLLKSKSFFLFGPRATGKSHLIRNQLADSGHKGEALIIDLLRSNYALQLSAQPSDLERLILATKPRPKWVVLDEIQKIPALLDEVHRLIELHQLTFLLTGSSARKLKRGQANLLGGRAWQANLFPLTSHELQQGHTAKSALSGGFDLDRYLRFGGLPTVYLSAEPAEELDAYVHTYLYEEIQAEGLIRRLAPFARFLKTAALANGQLLNFAQIARDAQVSASTVREHYYLLEDTLMGFMLEPWTFSKKRKAISTAKFYFFDTGVTHTLSQTRTLDRNSDLYGRSFEQWIAMELRAALSYQRTKESLYYWRSTNGHEVDFIIGDRCAIEVKSSTHISPRDTKGLVALKEEAAVSNYYLVSQDPIEVVHFDNIQCIHWQTFLTRLWRQEL